MKRETPPETYYCHVCGSLALFGFGQMWACREHRGEIEQEWKARGKPA